MKKIYTRHPASALFPDMPEAEFTELRDSIQKHGLKTPIDVTNDGKQIVDGWHRFKACELTTHDPKFRVLPKGTNPWEHAIAMNVRRRQLTATQRASIVAKAMMEAEAYCQHGGDRKSIIAQNQEMKSSLDRAAQAAGVGIATMREAARVTQKAPKLAEKMQRGEISTREADKQMRAEQKAETSREFRDKHGDVVPAHLQKDFDDTTLRDMCRRINEIRTAIDERCQAKDRVFAYVHRQQVLADLNMAREHLHAAQLFCLCPCCAGDKGGCDNCKRTGWVTRMVYDSSPKSLKRGAK